MQADIPQIVWHDQRNKIMSIDFYPNSDTYFATSSFATDEDSGIKFWHLKHHSTDAGFKAEPQYLYDLQGGHQKAINCIRFAPNGNYLASCSDDQLVIIWQLKSMPVEFGRTEQSIQWGQPRQLRGHVGDVMDLCWSNDSNFLVSGSLDGSAILWSIKENKFNKVQTFEGHKKYVQGVALHPLLKLVATASSDATVRIFQNRKLKQQLQFYHRFTIKQREEFFDEKKPDDQQPIEDKENQHANERPSTGAVGTSETKRKAHRLFLDDTEYTSFVRRLAWSPDGSFLLTPSSWYQELTAKDSISSEKFKYTVYGFMKSTINRPSFMLPGMKTHANCIRFCPYLLKLQAQPEDKKALIDLPYRLVFAVATIDHVIIYTT